MATATDLLASLRTREPGGEVSITVQRGTGTMTATVVLAGIPD